MTATKTRIRRENVTKGCAVCGESFSFANPWGDKARVVHNCPSNACGPTWTLYGPVIR